MSSLTIKNIFNSYPIRLILFLELTFVLFRVLFIALVFLKGKTIDALDIPYLFIYARYTTNIKLTILLILILMQSFIAYALRRIIIILCVVFFFVLFARTQKYIYRVVN
jgi:hypothetical protein